MAATAAADSVSAQTESRIAGVPVGDLPDSTDFTVPGLEPPLDSAAFRRLLGPPDSVRVNDHPFDTGAKLATWYFPGIEVFLNSDGDLSGITLLDGSRATRRGMRVGDSLARVSELYGPNEKGERAEFDFHWAEMDLRVVRVWIVGGRVSRIYVGWLLD